MLGLDGGDCGEGGIDAVRRLGRVARDLEVDQRGVAVGRDLPPPVSGDFTFSRRSTLESRLVTSSTAARNSGPSR